MVTTATKTNKVIMPRCAFALSFDWLRLEFIIVTPLYFMKVTSVTASLRRQLIFQ